MPAVVRLRRLMFVIPSYEAGVSVTPPKPMTSNSKSEGRDSLSGLQRAQPKGPFSDRAEGSLTELSERNDVIKTAIRPTLARWANVWV
jgi:hypothetical protein